MCKYCECSSLSSIIIPNSVKNIGNQAFSWCSSLSSIIIPNTVINIGDYAFEGTKWYDNQPDGLVYVGHFLYKYKGTIPANAKIAINEGTKGIKCSAFLDCVGLTSITIPNSVTSIGHSAFSGCSGLTSITLPNSITSIGYKTFYNCSALTSITIPNSVTSIGESAFEGCSALTSVTIPNSVTTIEIFAFYGCVKLKDFHLRNNHPENIKIAAHLTFSGSIRDCTLYVPFGTKYAFMDDEAFNVFKKINIE
ncbi:MAG: leucine-rich repeat domain-containing protein [Paludibacteraceae bacterium]|nr:leucine-rich repeat domain-containing protein [Paludibacteraceae bacterium]